MALAQFPELRKLPKGQKLKLAEELWCAAVDDSAPVSAEHRSILDSRWKAYRAGKTERISLSELNRRLARK
ncbi:addiction module protein [Horticoccus sp. 23ND18S-11]|uniref:addiction module protein n=1 Tax=Horticoccus sp. 23ND18S-11 TaxID=3391832 RepID=UPI0039C8FB40